MEVLPPLVTDADGFGDEIEPPATSASTRPYFFFAGRLERIKGLDDVIPVFRSGDVGADLLVAGAGAHEKALRAIAGDSPHIRFLGRLAPEGLGPLYRHAVAHIASSVCFETFGNTLIESFRQGTPVIARRIGTFPEIVALAGAGELFNDADELRAAIGRLVSDREYRDRLGAEGRKAYRSTWSETAIIPRYLEIVERAMHRHSAAPVGAPSVAESAAT